LRKVLVTGSAGFIGFHLSKLLLDEGFKVIGFDGMTDYYDITLKERRHGMLKQNAHFSSVEARLEDMDALTGEHGVEHLLMASTSSVYGANVEMPFIETEKADTQMTLYAATKKANESMAHSYAHLWKIPTTMFRFFTVYGPWGRPDMALFKFVKATLDGDPIDVYNHGKMFRDFTYVEDLVRGIRLLIDTPPVEPENREDIEEGDSLSPVGPYRVINIGNSTKIPLMEFVEEIEKSLGIKPIINFMEMQKGDVPATYANAELLQKLTGYTPQTDVATGVKHFVDWYRNYYQK